MPDLSNIQPGDKVALRTRMGYWIETVERVTKTQIVLAMNQRFRRTDGRVVGGRSARHPVSIVPVTPQIELQVLADRAKQDARNAIHTLADKVNRAEVIEVIERLHVADALVQTWRDAEDQLREVRNG